MLTAYVVKPFFFLRIIILAILTNLLNNHSSIIRLVDTIIIISFLGEKGEGDQDSRMISFNCILSKEGMSREIDFAA